MRRMLERRGEVEDEGEGEVEREGRKVEGGAEEDHCVTYPPSRRLGTGQVISHSFTIDHLGLVSWSLLSPP